MIERVTYERLFNLGNYENLKLCATALVEDGNVPAAFVEAKRAVEDQHAAFLAERQEAQRREQEEYEERQRQAHAKWEVERQRQMDTADRAMLEQADGEEDDRDDPVF